MLQAAGRETFEAVAMLQSIQKQPYTPAGGAEYPRGPFGDSLQQIAQLIKADVGVEMAFADIGGWDHHVNEPRRSFGEPADAISARRWRAFWQDMGDRMEDVAVVTMSEFGRTAHENGNRGTDHGHANCMFVMGGGVKGGKVYGKWPGLENEQLYEGRDLALTTDFRDVLGRTGVARTWEIRRSRACSPGTLRNSLGWCRGASSPPAHARRFRSPALRPALCAVRVSARAAPERQ